MWKKKFLPYALEDKMTATSPQTPESTHPLTEMQLMREQLHVQQHQPVSQLHGQQHQPVRQCPPAAHQNYSEMPTGDPGQATADINWTQVPVVQQTIPHITQANPINHMHQQQMMYDMEMYRRQRMHEMGYIQNHQYPSMYSMVRAPMFPNVPLYKQEMMDENAMQRYQHERYLQQARDMQMADLHAEQKERFQRMLAEKEKIKDASRGDTEDNVVRDRMMRRSSYKAVMKNGKLVEAEDGYLIVTNNIVVNNGQADTSYIYKDSPLNLSLKDQMISQNHNQHSDTDSGYINSPPQADQDTNTAINLAIKVPNMQGMAKIKTSTVAIIQPPAPLTKIIKLLPKIAPKPSPEKVKAVQPKDEVLTEDANDVHLVDPSSCSPTRNRDMKTMFPHLKMTNTGSLVLWNFLWALLQDSNHKEIVTWVSFHNLKFRIVNPSLLASVWGQVKQNPSMDWEKIKKILDLYLRKNLISSSTTEHEFTFLIVPKAIKQSLNNTEK